MNKTIAPIKELALIRQDLGSNKVQIVATDKVREFMELKTSLEAEIKATWKAIESYMIDNNIKDVYNLTIAEKKTWKVTGQLPPRFYKKTLDTSRLNFDLQHDNKLPKGASFTTSKYLTKTNRKVEVLA